MATINTLEKRIDGIETKIEVGFTRLSDQLSEKIENLVDGLAIMVKEGFDRVDERFEQVDERFEQIDQRFDDMDKRFDRIENISVGGHERRIENLEDRIRVVETKTKIRK